MNNNYFKSRVFKNLFVSYITIIILCFLIYTSQILYVSWRQKKENLTIYYKLKLKEMSSVLESEIMDCKKIVSIINNSDSIKNLYLSLSNQNRQVDAYTVYQALNDFKNSRKVTDNIDIYDTILFLEGSSKAYTGNGVLLLDKPYENNNSNGATILRPESNNEFDIVEMTGISFYGEFLLYIDDYSYNYNATTKGTICVLINKASINRVLNEILEEGVGFEILNDSSPIMGGVNPEGIVFSLDSNIIKSLKYNIAVHKNKFYLSRDSLIVFIIALGGFISLIFIVLAYYFSGQYYNLIKRIKNIFNPIDKEYKDEITEIIEGAEILLGQRDAYRNKILTISPFAQQGMLHGLLSGNLEDDNIKTLYEQNYITLNNKFFSVSIINIGGKEGRAYHNQEYNKIKKCIFKVPELFSTEEIEITCYEKDYCNIYIIVTRADKDENEELIYSIYNYINSKIEKNTFVITVGVDSVKEDINLLSESCINAAKALDGMMLGGRGSVFFYEDVEEVKYDYYFPEDAVHKILKFIKAKDLISVNEFLDEIYNKNVLEYDCSPNTVYILKDELYIVALKTLKKLELINSVKLDKLDKFVTAKEIFDYYKEIYANIIQHSQINITDRDADIIKYIEDHCMDATMSIALVTEKFGVSNKYVSVLFKRQLNTYYMEFIQQKRIRYAIELLETSKDSIEQISEKCGYSSILTFRRNFKAVAGMNPSQYRG